TRRGTYLVDVRVLLAPQPIQPGLDPAAERRVLRAIPAQLRADRQHPDTHVDAVQTARQQIQHRARPVRVDHRDIDDPVQYIAHGIEYVRDRAGLRAQQVPE